MKLRSGDTTSFLNWIVFILLLYTICVGIMFEGVENVNFIMVGVIIALLLGQITLFIKSKKPRRIPTPTIYNIHTRDPEGQELYRQSDKKYRKKYRNDKIIYYTIFIMPMILTALSLYSVFDFNIGMSFFIFAVISTICMVILIKVFDIGIKETS